MEKPAVKKNQYRLISVTVLNVKKKISVTVEFVFSASVSVFVHYWVHKLS